MEHVVSVEHTGAMGRCRLLQSFPSIPSELCLPFSQHQVEAWLHFIDIEGSSGWKEDIEDTENFGFCFEDHDRRWGEMAAAGFRLGASEPP